MDPEGLRFDSSWGLGMCSLSQTRDKTKKHFSLFLYRAQNVLSLLFYYKNCMVDSKENDKSDQGIKTLPHDHRVTTRPRKWEEWAENGRFRADIYFVRTP